MQQPWHGWSSAAAGHDRQRKPMLDWEGHGGSGWEAAQAQTYQQLNTLLHVPLTATATQAAAAGETHITVELANANTTVALMAKLTLRNADSGERILPVYYEDNYVSLAPGEKRTVGISAPAAAVNGPSASR